ncbi:PHP domain-containing protein [Helicovermis profundi]|uniref:PHP domain-containing protein n=1 Tax=Helicovermis profundi TaxID=3065157 RepID=A0AAU9EB03_9FIRM|nr:PHP domain-containing protein [Clostridia bacterium S502]
MKAYFDFHIHSCLSPCADDEMTPNNIINMSLLKGLDAIAITDHNSIRNCEVCIELGLKSGLIVFAGMELQTNEDVHMICLFRNIDLAKTFFKQIKEKQINIKNNKKKFGNQQVMDINDNIVGEEENALIMSINIGINEAIKLVKNNGGVIFPAHIDRGSNSIVSNLGFIPTDLMLNIMEISFGENSSNFLSDVKYTKFNILRNSDAHFLGNISERENYLEVKNINKDDIFDKLLELDY